MPTPPPPKIGSNPPSSPPSPQRDAAASPISKGDDVGHAAETDTAMRSPVRQSLDDWYTVLILLEQQNKIRYLQFRQQEEVLAARAPLLLNFRRTLTLSDQENKRNSRRPGRNRTKDARSRVFARKYRQSRNNGVEIQKHRARLKPVLCFNPTDSTDVREDV
jgi:hypothetical protein